MLPRLLYVFIAAAFWGNFVNCGFWTRWSSWSSCSSTCGLGMQDQKRSCFRKRARPCIGISSRFRVCEAGLCPSYLGKPRVHFSGEFVSDVTTVNNIRCMFDPDHFCPRCNKDMEIYNTPSTSDGTQTPEYKKYQHSPFWNSVGGNHFYFQNTYVTSACWEEQVNCIIDDPIVGRKVENPFDGRIVDLDVDWQIASTIFGFQIRIPGVLQSRMKRSGVTNLSSRNVRKDDASSVGMFKSKLVDVVWLDSYFAKKFRNSRSLSISFTVDMFENATVTGRVTGTIGMTSSDDPKNAFAGREMNTRDVLTDYSQKVSFYVDRDKQMLTVDLSPAMPTDRNGKFSSSYVNLKSLALVVVLNSFSVQTPDDFPEKVLFCNGYNLLKLTQEGDLDYLFLQDWYLKFGGVVQISLKHLSDKEFDLVTNNRIGFVDEDFLSKGDLKNLQNSDEVNKMKSSNMKCRIMFLEDKLGINLKYFGDFTTSLSFKQSWNISVIASRWGRPVVGSKIELKLLKQSVRFDTCKNRCSPFLSEPKNVLNLGSAQYTDLLGMAHFTIKVAKRLGNPRKCGLDGQVYPLGIILTYVSPDQESYRVGEGGMFDVGGTAVVGKAKKQCGLDAIHSTMMSAVRIYSSMPKSVMRKKCPTWADDVKPIFYFYANIAPVMAKYGTINMKSFEDVRSKLQTINMSMFGYDFDHPNFMPVTRDLSPDKTEIIRKWLTCEIEGDVSVKTKQSKAIKKMKRYETCGNPANLEKTLSHIRDLLQLAIWVELYTIPPYLTAYLSIKTKSKVKVRSLLKSVATEEMLHLSLAANLLNAVGGVPKLADIYWLPHYPTYFPSKSFIQILPDLEMNLEKFSPALALSIFSEIEKPASLQVFNIFRSISGLWKALPKAEHFHNTNNNCPETCCSNEKTERFHKFYGEAESFSPLNSGIWRKAFNLALTNMNLLRKSNLDSIGSLYAYIMLELMQVESCVKLKNPANTIFIQNSKRQLDSAQWYVADGVTKGRLFSVTNLKSSLEALFEIAYEGEGGIACAPFISTISGKIDDLSLGFDSKSHFIKFQELAFERELIVLTEPPPPWAKISCIEHNSNQCGCVLPNGTVSYSTRKHCLHFCFAGESLSIDPKEEIWPSQSLPDHSNESISTETRNRANHFDQTYTNLLHCLETSFNGNPNKMLTCMGNMYELLSIGEQLVQMPIEETNVLSEPTTALPRWKYIRDHFKNENLYVTIRNLENRGGEFC